MARIESDGTSVSKGTVEETARTGPAKDGVRNRKMHGDSIKVPGPKEVRGPGTISDRDPLRTQKTDRGVGEGPAPEVPRNPIEHRDPRGNNARRAGRGRNIDRAPIADEPPRNQRKTRYRTRPGMSHSMSFRPFPKRTGSTTSISGLKSCTRSTTSAFSTARRYRLVYCRRLSKVSTPPDVLKPVRERPQPSSSQS